MVYSRHFENLFLAITQQAVASFSETEILRAWESSFSAEFR